MVNATRPLFSKFVIWDIAYVIGLLGKLINSDSAAYVYLLQIIKNSESSEQRLIAKLVYDRTADEELIMDYLKVQIDNFKLMDYNECIKQ